MSGFVPGTVLDGKYRLHAPIGSGAMGTVWRAEHLTLRSVVAVKVMNQRIAGNPDALERFQREARAAAALRSPHVVSVLDSGVHEGAPFVVMELLEGESLDQRLARMGRLSLEDTLRIVTEVARALTRAHEAGVVHRDLKPANVFLERNADEELAKVLDFGVAKLAAITEASPLTSTGAVVGSPHYMSPEQARGRREVDWRADLWALGVIAFECVTGRRPFESPVLGDLLLKICTEPAPIPSSLVPLPASFDAWFARALDRDPEQRFQSATELAEALRALVPAPSLPPRAAPAARPVALAPLSTPARSAGSSIALVLGIGALGLGVSIVIAAAVAVLVMGKSTSTTAAADAGPAPVPTPASSAPAAPSESAPPIEKPAPAKPRPRATASAAPAAGTSSGPNPCEKACNKVRACAPGANCDASGTCSGVKKALADCINATPCTQLDKCLP